MDDVVVIDDMDAMTVPLTTGARVADDQSAAEKGLDAIVVEVDPQTLPDQLRRSAVEDALDQETAGAGDRHHGLGEVIQAALRADRLRPRAWPGITSTPANRSRMA